MKNDKSKFILFEVWKKCNNNCPFCFNHNMLSLNDVSTLTFIYNFLCSNEIFAYNKIGLIGGELFDGLLNDATIKEHFYAIVDRICTLINDKKISEFYVSANLLYDLTCITEFLNFVKSKNCLEHTIICTSYDTIGRFKTKDAELLWKYNILKIKSCFLDVKIHTEIILTDNLIDLIANDTIDIYGFSKTYQTSVDFLEPFAPWSYSSKQELQNVLPNFFTTRQKFISFLTTECIQKQKINIYKLFSSKLRANYLYFGFNGLYMFFLNRHDIDNCFNVTMNGLAAKLGYIDSDIRMVDDVEKIRNAIS